MVYVFFITFSMVCMSFGQPPPSAGKTMRAVLVRNPGGAEVLKVETVPIPQPGKDEVLVHIYAAGVNHIDVDIVGGNFGTKVPFVPGIDGAGIVDAVGPDVTRFKKGDRVFIFTTPDRPGTFAQYAVALQDRVFPLPSNVSFSQGGASGLGYFIAYQAIFQTPKAKRPKTVLVHGASGGVGLAAVQLASQAGFTVYGTAGSQEGLDVVKKAGAAYVFNHRNGSKELESASTKIGGLDLILEMVANVNLAQDLDLVSKKGTIVVIGSKGPATIDPSQLINNQPILTGVLSMDLDQQQIAETGAAISSGLKNGSLIPVVDEEFPLEKAGDALKAINENGATRSSKGKLAILTDK